MSQLFVFFGVISVMSVMSVVVNASLLRDTEHTLDAALNAADDPADRAAHGPSDWTCRTIALLGPFLRAPNDALSLRCQGHGKNGERQ